MCFHCYCPLLFYESLGVFEGSPTDNEMARREKIIGTLTKEEPEKYLLITGQIEVQNSVPAGMGKSEREMG